MLNKLLAMLSLLACLSSQARASDCIPVQVDAAAARARIVATSSARATACIDIVRTPRLRTGSPELKVLVFGDPQVQLAEDVDYYQRDIVAPLLGKHGAALGLMLGDLVDDEPWLYPQVKAATERLGIPWLYAPGNHDIDPGALDDASALQGFHRAIGPDTHARETPLATFVVLDDVITLPGRKPAYIGGFRDDQFAFLDAVQHDPIASLLGGNLDRAGTGLAVGANDNDGVALAAAGDGLLRHQHGRWQRRLRDARAHVLARHQHAVRVGHFGA